MNIEWWPMPEFTQILFNSTSTRKLEIQLQIKTFEKFRVFIFSEFLSIFKSTSNSWPWTSWANYISNLQLRLKSFRNSSSQTSCKFKNKDTWNSWTLSWWLQIINFHSQIHFPWCGNFKELDSWLFVNYPLWLSMKYIKNFQYFKKIQEFWHEYHMQL